jgi:hypothetical protein
MPVEFVETPDQKQITELKEYFDVFRVIHMDAKHPDNPKPTFMGNEVGHWENGTLVVDTVGVSTLSDGVRGLPHSPDMHIVERIRFTGLVLEDQVTIDDTKVFTKPWSYTTYLKRAPAGMRIREWVCVNNRNGPDETGRTTVRVGAPSSSSGPPA